MTEPQRFAISSSERSAKGRRWMRALQRQTLDAWMASTDTDTSLCQCHGLVAECELIAISTAFAATATRVLDLEVFQAEHGQAYLDAKADERKGQVVDGLVLIRNAEIHLPVILDPDIPRVLSMITHDGRQLFRVSPKWKPYEELPADVQSNERTHPRCHSAYRNAVAGESVYETLLDSLAWFLSCDTSLAHRDGEGQLEGFPLPELWQHEHERRHPEWKQSL